MADMARASAGELRSWATQLAIAAQTYSDHCTDTQFGLQEAAPLVDGTSNEIDRARHEILSLSSRLRTHVLEPTELIQDLACHNQLLMCLNWLGNFQILACIPLTGSIPIEEVADIADVSEVQLCRIVRMTATAGFLCEPESGRVAHTTLSSAFVINLSHLDAAMFLAETAAPAAMRMAKMSQSFRSSDPTGISAYSVAFNTTKTLYAACSNDVQLKRRWTAYRRYVVDSHTSVAKLLGQLNWRALGDAYIVDVSAPSTETARALSKSWPDLRFIVQMAEPSMERSEDLNRRITVQKRMPAAPQVVEDAAVYILRTPASLTPPPSEFSAELNEHLIRLRANPLSTLILTTLYLPEPGTVDPQLEALARGMDLSRHQLVAECGLEIRELIDIIVGTEDSNGHLTVVNKICSCNDTMMALGVRYEARAQLNPDTSGNQ